MKADPRLANRPVGLSSVFATILLAEAIGRALPPAASVVVDVGGGEAPYASSISSALHVAVDRRSPPDTLASHQVVGDAALLPVGDGLADLVLCTEVVEHVPDDHQLYRELRRIITADGTLVLSAPFVHALHESPHDYRRPTSAGLVHGLTTAGFEVDRIDAVGGTADVVRDLCIRTVAPKVSAIGRRVPSAVTSGLNGTVLGGQRRMANRSIRRQGGSLVDIDPLAPVPRLTLGYVVLARPG